MVEILKRYINMSSMINFTLVTIGLYVIVKHIIPIFFSKKDKESEKNFEALVRLKKQELTTTNIDLNSFDLKNNEFFTIKNDFLGFIESKFRDHVEFYKKLETAVGWQEGQITKDFKQYYPDLFQFDLQMLDIKKVLMTQSYELIHRGEYTKVILLAWFEKLLHCLSLDLPLPKLAENSLLSDNLSLWRWSVMRQNLEAQNWQEVLFDNHSLFAKSKTEILNTKSLIFLTKNTKMWWQRLLNILHQIEIFLPIDEFELTELQSRVPSKKDKLLMIKRYHPDTVAWEIISSQHKAMYEKLLNENFSKLSNVLLT